MNKTQAPSNIVGVGKRRQFSLKEARELLPMVKRLTAEAAKNVQSLNQHAEDNPQQQEAIQETVQRWAEKMTMLGCIPNGIWLVDFDNGQGYFCWQFGEDEIDYFHPYDTGYAGRTAIN